MSLFSALFGRRRDREPPSNRHREIVLLFAEHRPDATRAEWMEFAEGLAAEAWRSGFEAGWWAAEGEPDEVAARVERSERFADQLDPAWRSSPPADLRSV